MTAIPDSTHTQVFRVTVRGQFDQLTEPARAWLAAHACEHDIFVSKFTEEGTLTYDDRLQFFNMRFEVRRGNSDASAAEEYALAEAAAFLRTMKIGAKNLRAASMDMSAMVTQPRHDV